MKNILEELQALGSRDLAEHHMKFFQCQPGGYGEGDQFWGVKVPVIREIAKKHYKTLPLTDTGRLLSHPVHEVRLLGLVVMIFKMRKAEEPGQADLVKLYMANISHINNWDLVDISAHHILGAYWYGQKSGSEKLRKLADSGRLWEERIALLATFHHIRQNSYALSLEFVEQFLPHPHDLIHKASGWTLREIGKQNKSLLLNFLDKHHLKMPRTMLRYAIEKLNPAEKAKYMKKTIK